MKKKIVTKKYLAIDKSYNAQVKIRKLCDREKNYVRKTLKLNNWKLDKKTKTQIVIIPKTQMVKKLKKLNFLQLKEEEKK